MGYMMKGQKVSNLYWAFHGYEGITESGFIDVRSWVNDHLKYSRDVAIRSPKKSESFGSLIFSSVEYDSSKLCAGGTFTWDKPVEWFDNETFLYFNAIVNGVPTEVEPHYTFSTILLTDPIYSNFLNSLKSLGYTVSNHSGGFPGQFQISGSDAPIPPITVTIDGMDYHIPPEEFVWRDGEHVWVAVSKSVYGVVFLGAPFLRAFITRFDRLNERFGICQQEQ